MNGMRHGKKSYLVANPRSNERKASIMSYSRWGHSRWYTYWGQRESVIEDRDTALFVVCPIAEFTAEELRTDMDSCVAIAVEAEDESTFFVTSVEKNELRKYMNKFLADVDARYPET